MLSCFLNYHRLVFYWLIKLLIKIITKLWIICSFVFITNCGFQFASPRGVALIKASIAFIHCWSRKGWQKGFLDSAQLFENVAAFSYPSKNNSAPTRHSTCIAIHPNVPGCSCVPVCSCLPTPDGIISVILSHYRSSDANGYIENPAASSLDQCPYPLCPALWQLCLAQSR